MMRHLPTRQQITRCIGVALGAAALLSITTVLSRADWAYDRQSSIGRLDKGLNESAAGDWTVVDMKQEWKTIFISPAERRSGIAGSAS
ncbi:hypothetical protein VB618_18915 [Microvirga sp. CF3062]|uniref:hypothetical protein n=1 Tax=Microvirga sp. CF3062 TaxID=3110182 RepID=UPI002E769902|nr:hypothetical protein [Microvirga sp. CF3062]MEE1658275.1 hypothetical protein [Microvirga sp. CF3062]